MENGLQLEYSIYIQGCMYIVLLIKPVEFLQLIAALMSTFTISLHHGTPYQSRR